MLQIAVIILFMFLLGGVFLILRQLDPARRLLQELTARPPLTDAEMLARYFMPDDPAATIAPTVRQLFARDLDIHPEQLPPDRDLLDLWDELDIAPLIGELESTFGIVIRDTDAGQTRCTICDVSRMIADKMAKG